MQRPNYLPESASMLPGLCWGLLESPAALQGFPHSKKPKSLIQMPFKYKLTSADILEGHRGYSYYDPLFLCFLAPHIHI